MKVSPLNLQYALSQQLCTFSPGCHRSATNDVRGTSRSVPPISNENRSSEETPPRPQYLGYNQLSYMPSRNTPFCTPNRRLFISIWHIAIEFVTLILVWKRGGLFDKGTLEWRSAPQFDLGHIIDNGHSTLTTLKPLPKLNALCRLYDPSQTVVRFVKQVCTSS